MFGQWSSISSPSSPSLAAKSRKGALPVFLPKDELNDMRIAMSSRLWLNDSLSVICFVDEACVCACHNLRWE